MSALQGLARQTPGIGNVMMNGFLQNGNGAIRKLIAPYTILSFPGDAGSSESPFVAYLLRRVAPRDDGLILHSSPSNSAFPILNS